GHDERVTIVAPGLDPAGALNDAADRVAAQAVLRAHRPLQVDPGPRPQPAQGRDAVGLSHDVEAQLRALHLSDRQVDPVDSDAVAKLRAVLNPAHADPQEAAAGLHDLPDLLDDPGEHVECSYHGHVAPRPRLSPCPSELFVTRVYSY